MLGIALVRTEGKDFGDGKQFTPARLLTDPVLRRSSKTDRTRESEAALGLGDSLYFFVGRACQDFGQVVLAYHSAWSESAPGSITPFDTGGIHWGKIHAEGLHDADARRSYVELLRSPLLGWCVRFGEFIADHFASAASYVSGARALVDDPSRRLLDLRNQWRAWTWEVQLHRDHDIRDNLRLLCIPSDFAEELRTQLLALADEDAEPWEQLWDSGVIIVAPADEEPEMVCRMAEEKVASWL